MHTFSTSSFFFATLINPIRAFSFGALKIKIGDYVLVRNDDALDPEDTRSCYIAQVEDLFDSGEEYDPHQAKVKWFSRLPELPCYAVRTLNDISNIYEIVLEKRSSWSDIIDAETIFQGCKVIFIAEDTNYETEMKKYEDDPFLLFFCRYVFNGTSLYPIISRETKSGTKGIKIAHPNMSNGYIITDEQENIVIKKEKNEERKDLYYSTLIGNPEFPKVRIKRIDDKILESQNDCIRIIVAQSKDENVEKITKQFEEKCKLEKDDTFRKKPIVHKIKLSNDISDVNTDFPNDEYAGISKNFIEFEKVDNGTNFKFCTQNDNSGVDANFYSSEYDDVQFYSHSKTDNINIEKIIKKTCLLNVQSPKTKSSPRKRSKSSSGLSNIIPEKKVVIDDLCIKRSNPKLKPTNYNRCSPRKKTATTPKKKIAEMDETCLTLSGRKVKSLNYNKNTPRKDNVTISKSSCNTPQKKATADMVLKESCVKQSNQKGKSKNNNAECFPKKSLGFTSELCTTPKKKVKVEDDLKESCTRSGRRVKAVNYQEIFSPKKEVNSMTETLCATPKRGIKIERDLTGLSTRSGRRIKALNSKIDSDTKVKTLPNTSVKKKIPSFVLPSDAEDSDGSIYLGNEESADSSLSDSSVDYNISKKSKTANKSSRRTNKSATHTPVRKRDFTLNIPERKTPLRTPRTILEESRQRLHVSSVPKSLPCREEEYSDIYSFVKGCLCAQTGGCMYISGVPGTGKTATVHEVVRNLEEEKESGEVPIFNFVEVNGMWMTDPYQCYVHIFKSLTGQTIAPQQAANLLEKRFTEPGPKKDAVILLVDELDRLWTRKQTVMYNIFDWPSKRDSKLVVLAIANTMDLPERLMMNKISSRLGLTRKTFQPYTFRQLQEIIMSRIQELKVFDPDAVQLVSRKVAAVSGDARRALDICRFATEVAKSKSSKKGQKNLIGMEEVDVALQQMFSSPLISAIRSASKIAKLFFKCIVSEFQRTALEETTLSKVYRQLISICRFEGIPVPNFSTVSNIVVHLSASHLILVDNFQNDLHMKLRLNVSPDDVTYALTLN